MPDNLELSIIKGLGAVPGDTTSVEKPVEVLSLLDARGFSVAQDGWIPKLAQGKTGIWVDDPLSDGRTPVAVARGNVVEQIKLTATAATWDARYWLISRLAQFSRDAQDFHTGLSQIEPVYLKWHAQGAPGPQYALIYSVDIAQNTEAFLPVNVNELTITIEREPYWRGEVPPGGNPKLWTHKVLGLDEFEPSLTIYNAMQTPYTWKLNGALPIGVGTTTQIVKEKTEFGDWVVRCVTGTDFFDGFSFPDNPGGGVGTPVEGNHTPYTWICWVRDKDGLNPGLAVRAQVQESGTNDLLGTSNTVLLSTEWQPMTTTFVTELPETEVYIAIRKVSYAQSTTFEAAGFQLLVGVNKIMHGHLVHREVFNRCEYNADFTEFVTENFIDIPSDLIPGDAPALVNITATYGDASRGGIRNLYIGQTVNRSGWDNVYGDSFLQFDILNAVDGEFNTGTKTNDVEGVLPAGGATTQTYQAAVSAGASLSMVFSNPVMDLNLLRGRYAVYVRNVQTNGAAGDLQLKLRVFDAGADYNAVKFALESSENNAFFDDSRTHPGLTYLGAVSLPLTAASVVSAEGTGLEALTIAQKLHTFYVDVRNKSASTRNIRFTDLLLLPIHEAACVIGDGGVMDFKYPGMEASFVIDNTGYYTHGKPEEYARQNLKPFDNGQSNGFNRAVTVQGRIPTLVPGRDNRLYFFWDYNGLPGLGENMATTYPFIVIALNIVPRWIGVRAV